MGMLEDLKARKAAAEARALAAVLTADEAEIAGLLAAEADANEQARKDEAARRKIIGKGREADAKAKAAGKYAVEFFDLGALLPDTDPTMLPGNGILVIRSHPLDAKRAFDRDVEAKDRPLGDIFTDLVCASTVDPTFAKDDPAALRFRMFFESDLGSGCPAQIGAAVLRLGGARADEQKRALR